MSSNWNVVPFTEAVDICDTLRKPINSSERASRIKGKEQSELYPYYGATGQVGFIDDYITDGEYVLLGEDGAPFLDAFSKKAYIISGKTWVNNHAHVLKSKTNNKFLCYYLNSFNYKGYVSGTTRLKLTQAEMKRIPVPVPPLSEQERIVARIEELFSQLDAGVETLKKTKAQLAVYRQAAITEAFSVDNNTPNVCLSDIAQIIGGITKGRNLSGTETIELPYLRVANVQNGYLDLSEIKTIKLRVDEKERYLLKPGDVLYTEGGDRDKLGRGTVWRGEIKDCVHQNHIFKARVDQSKAIPEYVAFWSMSTPARNYFYQKGKQSVNLASINKTVLSALTLPLPALEKQREIINHIESRLSVCDSIEQTADIALQQAEAMRQSILKDAFEGNL